MTSMKNRASTSCGTVAFEQGVDGCRAEGSGEEVALAELAAELTQGRQLLGRLDTVGDGRQTQRLAEGEDPPGQGGVLAAPGQADDEGAVDLEDVDRRRCR
jgi:hypothetical protein